MFVLADWHAHNTKRHQAHPCSLPTSAMMWPSRPSGRQSREAVANAACAAVAADGGGEVGMPARAARLGAGRLIRSDRILAAAGGAWEPVAA